MRGKETHSVRDATALVIKSSIVHSTIHSTSEEPVTPAVLQHDMSNIQSHHAGPCTRCHVPHRQSALTADVPLQQSKQTVTFYEPKSSVEPTPPPACTLRAAYLKHAFNDWGDSRWQMAVLGNRTSEPGGPLHQPLMSICDI